MTDKFKIAHFLQVSLTYLLSYLQIMKTWLEIIAHKH